LRKEKDIRKIWESNKRIAIICGCILKKEDKKTKTTDVKFVKDLKFVIIMPINILTFSLPRKRI